MGQYLVVVMIYVQIVIIGQVIHPHTFPKLDIPSSFNTVDCEVFQIKHNSLS